MKFEGAYIVLMTLLVVAVAAYVVLSRKVAAEFIAKE